MSTFQFVSLARVPTNVTFYNLVLRSDQSSFEYDLKISPADNTLYLSHGHGHQVWKILELDPDMIDDVEANKEVVAGTGKR